MKRIYIKPETDSVTCNLIAMLAESQDPENKWNTQIGDGGTIEGVGEIEPNPGEEAKFNNINLWD